MKKNLWYSKANNMQLLEFDFNKLNDNATLCTDVSTVMINREKHKIKVHQNDKTDWDTVNNTCFALDINVTLWFHMQIMFEKVSQSETIISLFIGRCALQMSHILLSSNKSNDSMTAILVWMQYHVYTRARSSPIWDKSWIQNCSTHSAFLLKVGQQLFLPNWGMPNPKIPLLSRSKQYLSC